MIPHFNHSHVLPPMLGQQPATPGQMSPYGCSCVELVQRMGSSKERLNLLDGLLRYRAALRDLGFVRGFQWLDGSFVEDVESHQSRAPRDVDVVTFAHSPAGVGATELQGLLQANPKVFDAPMTKLEFGCDAYTVPLDKSPERLVARTAYYLQLFSHRRGDQVWKGLLQIPLESDDAQARQMLDNAISGENLAAPT